MQRVFLTVTILTKYTNQATGFALSVNTVNFPFHSQATLSERSRPYRAIIVDYHASL